MTIHHCMKCSAAVIAALTFSMVLGHSQYFSVYSGSCTQKSQAYQYQLAVPVTTKEKSTNRWNVIQVLPPFGVGVTTIYCNERGSSSWYRMTGDIGNEQLTPFQYVNGNPNKDFWALSSSPMQNYSDAPDSSATAASVLCSMSNGKANPIRLPDGTREIVYGPRSCSVIGNGTASSPNFCTLDPANPVSGSTMAWWGSRCNLKLDRRLTGEAIAAGGDSTAAQSVVEDHIVNDLGGTCTYLSGDPSCTTVYPPTAAMCVETP